MMSAPQPIHRAKLSDTVADRLRALLRDDHLVPGDELPSERDLMARYGVGRPAIREAMQDLARAGVIEIRHGGRARVAQPSLPALMGDLGPAMHHVLSHSRASLDHLKDARTDLECAMAACAASARTRTDLRDLSGILDAQEAAKTDGPAFLDADRRFHARLAAVTGNPIHETLTGAIFSWLRAFHVENVRKPGLEDLTLAEHHRILDAVADGDPGAAASAMRAHLERVDALYHRDNAT